MGETIAGIYHRNEVFWVGLFVVVLGLLVPGSLMFGGLDLSSLFVVTGGGLLVTSVFVGIYRLLSPA